MNIDILNFLLGEADEATSPQLRDVGDMAWAGRTSFAPSELSLIVALAAELEASEARARYAETLLAAHGRHCICRAAEIAGEEAMESHSAWTAEAAGGPVSGLATEMSEELPLNLAA